MKTIKVTFDVAGSSLTVALTLCFCAPFLFAQTNSPTTPRLGPKILEEQVLERALHEQQVRRVTQLTNRQGQSFTVTNRVHILSPGMNYQDDTGQLRPSRAEFLATDQGFAALEMGHKVRLARNLNGAGSVSITTPDGQVLRGHPLCLAYSDDTGRRVVIAELKDCQGELAATNVILYRDAFQGGFRADVRYTITASQIEQDVIFRSRPPAPEKYGLVSDRVRIEVLSEFLSPPTPRRQTNDVRMSTARIPGGRNRPAQARPAFADETLSFGSMTMLPGKAFSVGHPTAFPLATATVRAKNTSLPVAKRWTKLENRDCLVESLDYPAAKAHLDRLRWQPASTNRIQSTTNAVSAGQHSAVTPGQLPGPRPQLSMSPPPSTPSAPAGLVAAGSVPEEPGFVLDYNLMIYSGTYTDYTFASGETYEIYGWTAFDGLTTMNPGAIIRYATGASITVCYNGGTFECNATPEYPVWLTTFDDGSPQGGTDYSYYQAAAVALSIYWPYQNLNVSGLNIRHAAVGIEYAHFDENTCTLTLNDSTFFDCATGFKASQGTAHFNFNRVQMQNLGTAFDNSGYGYGTFIGALQDVNLSTVYAVSGNNAYNSVLLFSGGTQSYQTWGTAAGSLGGSPESDSSSPIRTGFMNNVPNVNRHFMHKVCCL